VKVNANWYNKSIKETMLILMVISTLTVLLLNFIQIFCMPIPLNMLPMQLLTKIKVCQVCNYEM
jgi:hypothetical protein